MAREAESGFSKVPEAPVIWPWVAAARPKTLFAAACPVVLGGAMAEPQLPAAWPWFLVTLACAVLLQITANLANDYWDFRKGADTHLRKGPLRMTASGLVEPRHTLIATLLALGLALLLGLALIGRGGWPIFGIGCAAALSAILYTAGPFPLAYLGLGELFALAFFGPVAVAGSAYLLSLEWQPSAFLLGLAPGGYAVVLMSINNLRDREEDARSGKRTLAVRFGEKFAAAIFVFSLWLPVAACGLVFAFGADWAAAGAGFVAILAALRLSRAFQIARPAKALNSLIPATAAAAILFTVAYALLTWLM